MYITNFLPMTSFFQYSTKQFLDIDWSDDVVAIRWETAALKDGQKKKTKCLTIPYYYNIFLISMKSKKEILNCKSHTATAQNLKSLVWGYPFEKKKHNSENKLMQGIFLRGT